MGDLSDITNRDNNGNNNKKQDTLFGPNIGVVTSSPAWTDASKKDKQPIVDQLTPDVVKGWIAKSKEVCSRHTRTYRREQDVNGWSDIPTNNNITGPSKPQTPHPPSLPFIPSPN